MRPRTARPWLQVAALLLVASQARCAADQPGASMHVVLLDPVGGRDNSAMASRAYEGIVAAQLGTALTLEELEPADAREAVALLEQALDPRELEPLVVAVGPVYTDPIDARGCMLRGARVLQLEGRPATCRALRSVALRVHGPAYLAGVVAMAASQIAPRRAAGVVAVEGAGVYAELARGFEAGVGDAGGTTGRIDLSASDLEDEDARQQALVRVAQLAADSDVLLLAGDARLESVLEAVRDANADSASPLRLIGVTRDLAVVDADTILASVLLRYDIEVRESIVANAVGAFASGHVERGYGDQLTEVLLNSTYLELAVDQLPAGLCEDCEVLADVVPTLERSVPGDLDTD